MEKKSNRKNNSLPRDIILQELRSRIESSLPGTRLPSENALAAIKALPGVIRIRTFVR